VVRKISTVQNFIAITEFNLHQLAIHGYFQICCRCLSV